MEKPYNIYEYEVLDRNGRRLGPITGYWLDESTGTPEFAMVKTGWLLGKSHVIPIRDAHFDYSGRRLRVPYDEARIKGAPGFDASQDLSPQEEQRIYAHYRLDRSLARSPTGLPGGAGGRKPTRDTDRTAEMTLHEEKVNVGKQQVETGQVRLRKVVKTDTVDVPVDLTRERIEIERIPASELRGTFSKRAWSDAFREDEIVMTERREEPVIEKHSEVTGGVRATKEVDRERRDVTANVRREEVEVDRDDESTDRRL